MPAEQLQFSFFASLDFPGRSTLMLHEIGERIGLTVQHLLNEIESGELAALAVQGKGVSRRCIRVPIECYRDYVLRKLSVPMRSALLKTLPRAVREQLIRELQDSLLEK
jgi:hypothetical protein